MQLDVVGIEQGSGGTIDSTQKSIGVDHQSYMVEPSQATIVTLLKDGNPAVLYAVAEYS